MIVSKPPFLSPFLCNFLPGSLHTSIDPSSPPASLPLESQSHHPLFIFAPSHTVVLPFVNFLGHVPFSILAPPFTP